MSETVEKKKNDIFESAFPYSRGLTHAGVFHADDVFSAAFLRMLNPQIEILRRTRVPEDFDGIVFDIGLGRFDHHQLDHEIRENGVPYAAFGLLWREFGELLLEPRAVRFLDETFVQKVDLHDNGGETNEVSVMISEMVPFWDEEKSMDEAFFEAVDVAGRILDRKIQRIRSRDAVNSFVQAAMKKGSSEDILILDRYCPWSEAVIGTPYKYVIFPSLRGGWNVQGVTQDPCEGQNTGTRRPLKVPFPAEWGGKSEEELFRILPGMTFVHPALFLAAADTLETAIQVAEESLKQAGS